MSDLNFTFSDAPVTEDQYSPIPAGEYPLAINKVQRRQSKRGTGDMLNIEFVVTDGQYEGRRIYQNFLLWHTDSEIQKRHENDLKRILHGAGLMPKQSLDELSGRHLIGDVRVQKSKDPQYGDSNNVRSGKPSIASASASPASMPWN